MTTTIPMKCLRCAEELVDTEEGLVPGYYGKLWFSSDPPHPKCPNCEAPLVPCRTEAV